MPHARNQRRLDELIDRAYALAGDAALDPYERSGCVFWSSIRATAGTPTHRLARAGCGSFLTVSERAPIPVGERQRALAALPLLPGRTIGCAR